jgi:hypothetical protein
MCLSSITIWAFRDRPHVPLNNIALLPQQNGYVPPNSKDEVNEIIEGFKPGRIAFNTPRSLPLGKEETIKVRLSTRKSIPELKRMINAVGEILGEEIEVYKVMQARYLISPHLVRGCDGQQDGLHCQS